MLGTLQLQVDSLAAARSPKTHTKSSLELSHRLGHKYSVETLAHVRHSNNAPNGRVREPKAGA